MDADHEKNAEDLASILLLDKLSFNHWGQGKAIQGPFMSFILHCELQKTSKVETHDYSIIIKIKNIIQRKMMVQWLK